jgi:aminoglycoside 2''-phosphotransferase
MNTKDQYLSALLRNYPELVVRSAVLNVDDGQFNDILLINDALIFRFPKYAGGVQALQQERSVLQTIQGRIGLRIPEPIYHSGTETIPARVFIGYRKIPGLPLWHPTLERISTGDVRERIARQLARFLADLHAIPSSVWDPTWPIQDTPADWLAFFEEVEDKLFPFMREDARVTVSKRFSGYRADPALHDFEPALRHGDFGSGNLLYDPEEQRIAGVIDFGSAGPGDPAVDIASAATMGEELFSRFSRYYPGLDALLPRADFYRSTYALMEALHGFNHNDHKAFRAGMELYV